MGSWLNSCIVEASSRSLKFWIWNEMLDGGWFGGLFVEGSLHRISSMLLWRQAFDFSNSFTSSRRDISWIDVLRVCFPFVLSIIDLIPRIQTYFGTNLIPLKYVAISINKTEKKNKGNEENDCIRLLDEWLQPIQKEDNGLFADSLTQGWNSLTNERTSKLNMGLIAFR